MKLAPELATAGPKPKAPVESTVEILPVRRSKLAIVGMNQAIIRNQLVLVNPSPRGPRLRFSRTRVQHYYSLGSSTIKLFSNLVEYVAYAPNRKKCITPQGKSQLTIITTR